MYERFIVGIGYGKCVVEWERCAWLNKAGQLTTAIEKRAIFNRRESAREFLRSLNAQV